MKNKKLIAWLLCITMLFTLITPAFAEALSSATTGSMIEFEEEKEESGESNSSEELLPLFKNEEVTTSSSITVGSKVWIKPNSILYKNAGDEEGRESRLSYHVEIEDIETLDNITWYQFKYLDFGAIIGNIFLRGCNWVKAEDISVEEPNTTKDPIHESMTRFVEIVEQMPDAEAVNTFNLAITDYAEIHTVIPIDTPLPDLEIQQYEDAYRAFAQAMGYDPATVEINYPNPAILDELKEAVISAYILLEESEELYSAQNTSESDSVVELDASYAAAKNKLDSIIEVMPELLEYDIALMARALGNGVSTVDAEPENIQINLFNYGPQINTQRSGYGLIPFVHSEGTYGWAVDSSGNKPSASAGGWPPLNTVLTDSQKFPYVSADKSVIKKGSLGYLFDPQYSGTGRIDLNTYYNNILGDQNPYQYASAYFPVANDDGTGTGLFQKEGNYFVYDSGKNAAWYNKDTQKFELYNYVVRPAYTTFSTSGTNGNFLPFNQGHDPNQGREDYQAATYTKEYSYTNDKGEKVETSTTIADPDTVTGKPDGALTAYRLYGNARASEADLWFGMSMEFDFYQPKGGLVDNESMVFEFLGDDDVWVFVDDVLILDIGGTHGALTGRIDFANGTVTNPEGTGQYTSNNLRTSTLYDLMHAALGNSIDNSQFVDSNGDGTLDTFADFTKHNLKFFYLERGGNISYCKLKFNMDPLPTGSISVEKDVTGISGNIQEDRDYTFTISATPKNEEDTISEIAYTKYKITNTSEQTKGTVENGGEFTLENDEKIVFDLKVGTEVIITEEENTAITKNTSWKLNGTNTDGRSITYTIQEGTGEAAFICTNTRVTDSLTIKKEFIGKQYEPDKTFTLNLAFGGINYTGPVTVNDNTVDITNGAITVKTGDVVTVSGIPTGMSYTLNESNITSNFLYAKPLINDTSYDFGANYSTDITSCKQVVVKNAHVLADLTIDKELTEAQMDENQAFLYTVSGGPAQINLDVVVCGDGQLTVKDLPVGVGDSALYTVTEDGDWCWRYELNGAYASNDTSETYNMQTSSLTFTLTESNETTVFTNDRIDPFWLSGDSYCENWWGGITGNVLQRFANNRLI